MGFVGFVGVLKGVDFWFLIKSVTVILVLKNKRPTVKRKKKKARVNEIKV